MVSRCAKLFLDFDRAEERKMLAHQVEVGSAKTATVSREEVWSGAVVSIAVPDKVVKGQVGEGDDTIHYFRFARHVKGGSVYCFVHTSDEALLGRTIRVSATVMRRTLSDGRKYLYVDFRPVEKSVPPTHRLAVMQEHGVWSSDWQIFEMLSPLRGAIIFAPPEAKITPEAQAPRPISTDPQLDRLLSQGWRIKENGLVIVTLFKLDKKGGEVTIKHHRPKKNGHGK